MPTHKSAAYYFKTLGALRWARPLVPHSIRSLVRHMTALVWRSLPDRRYMEKVMFPRLGALGLKNVLFVGVAHYTQHYWKWFSPHGSDFWTIDRREEVSRFGAKGKHVVGNILEADNIFGHGKFDMVIFSGVLGFGVNEIADQNRSILVIKKILKPNGILVIGWNTSVVEDPRHLEALTELFSPSSVAGLPDRKQINGSDLVLDLYIAR